MTTDPKVQGPSQSAAIWKRRQHRQQLRRFAAHQREVAASSRASASEVRGMAARIRADAAVIRDSGARARDDAARVRDSAARVRDFAALARDQSSWTREEAMRKRLLMTEFDTDAMTELLELDRRSSAQAHEAASRDREAANLDRTAAEKDRDAAEKDRAAAARDRDAAEKDHEASEKDRSASDADRAAADSDREESELELGVAEARLTRHDHLAGMGRLASGVSHELSTPLATLLTTLSTLNAELAGSASTRPLLDDARVAAERMQHVLSEMKVWIRDGSDKPTLLLLDPRSVIEQAVERSRSLIEPAAKLTVELGTLVPVSGVASRLVLVLTNLLTNAVGALAHTTNGEVRVVAHADADRVRISVSDTGSGIAPEVLPHIFDPFFSTRESGGMGIGLAMCERIIHDHDGVITVETEVGKGTTFHVDLPAAAPVVTAPQSTPTRQRVLIIEDDDAFSRSLQRLLRVRCDVTIAENGLVALAELKKPGEWDLVLCDLMMPMMNGLELYEQLLLIAPKLAAQLVFISAGGTTDATRAFLARVPNRQLQKPFEVAALFRMLDERLTRPS